MNNNAFYAPQTDSLGYVFRGQFFERTVPTGRYDAVISRASTITNKEDQKIVVITWKIAYPDTYKGKEVTDFFDIESSDTERREDAMNQLTTLIVGLTGSRDLVNWDDLLDKAAYLKIDCYTSKDGELKNKIRSRTPRGTAKVNSNIFS